MKKILKSLWLVFGVAIIVFLIGLFDLINFSSDKLKLASSALVLFVILSFLITLKANGKKWIRYLYYGFTIISNIFFCIYLYELIARKMPFILIVLYLIINNLTLYAHEKIIASKQREQK